jgi:hypothetical protein
MASYEDEIRRDPRLEALFSGPSPSARRIDGLRDGRAGRPPASQDPHYRSGYAYALGDRARAAVRT